MCEKKQGTSETVKIIDFGCAKGKQMKMNYVDILISLSYSEFF